MIPTNPVRNGLFARRDPSIPDEEHKKAVRAAMVRALANQLGPLAEQIGPHVNQPGPGTGQPGRDTDVGTQGMPEGSNAGPVPQYQDFVLDEFDNEIPQPVRLEPGPDGAIPAAAGTRQEDPAGARFTSAFDTPTRSPAAAGTDGQQVKQPDASGDQSENSREELARQQEIEKIRPFVATSPWGANLAAFSAEQIQAKYPRGKQAGDPFKSPEDAVKAALKPWKTKRHEYLAMIFQFGDGPNRDKYTWGFLQRGYYIPEKRAKKIDPRATGPIKGVDLPPREVNKIRSINNAKLYAWAHTHSINEKARGVARSRVAGPSKCDKDVTFYLGIKGYLLRNGVESIEPEPHPECRVTRD